jgi:hypothetical protein
MIPVEALESRSHNRRILYCQSAGGIRQPALHRNPGSINSEDPEDIRPVREFHAKRVKMTRARFTKTPAWARAHAER